MAKRYVLWCIILVFLILTLPACDRSTLSSAGQNTNLLTPTTVPAQLATNALHRLQGVGHFTEYPLPQTHSGMMRPAIDHNGRLWFGEMRTNALASFDLTTATFTQVTPPRGAYGIMGVATAPDNSIWFAEQYANYIGHYVPTTRQFQVYDLPRLSIPGSSQSARKQDSLPVAPNDIALDAHGNVWFTELNADAVGMLDPRSGKLQHFPITPARTIQKYNPYGLTIDNRGFIWFTTANTNLLAKLDPDSKKIQLFAVPDSSVELMETTSDPSGMIWVTTFNKGRLYRFDPIHHTFTAFAIVEAEATASPLYGIAITGDRSIWLTVPSENALERLDPTTNQITTYTVPTAGSSPIGITAGTGKRVWFTESGSDQIGMLIP